MAIMGLIPVMSASQLDAARRAQSEAQQQTPLVQGLAGHVRKRWELAKTSKLDAEARMLKSLRQRNGEYDPDKLSEIRKFGGSEIYMMLSANKARGVSAWLRDILLGTGTDKPWTIEATPLPEIPPDVVKQLFETLQSTAFQYISATGQTPPDNLVREFARDMRDTATQKMQEEAQERVSRMEIKMEDQLLEGGFPEAMAQFLEDLCTFPTAILKGPVVKRRKVLQWVNGGLVPVEVLRPEWERVDPFAFYPSPGATGPQDGFVIERHKMSREDLEGLIGLDGFDEEIVRESIRGFGSGLRENLTVDSQAAAAVEKNDTWVREADETIDVLQLWDTIPGAMLADWGMELEDLEKAYPCEIWAVGAKVLKAVLNYDPLGRKPYYVASYERVPGAFWGNSPLDLIRDCQDMCNAAARALANNMGISSGPQVAVNVSRLPAGEPVTQMYPWKIWQVENSDFQDNSPPVSFFQPGSNAAELMAVYDKFSSLADEYSIPKYMMGDHQPGIGRTSSGLSIMVGNAAKNVKSVIATVDRQVLTPLLERLYQYNLRYADDPDLIGDVTVVAKGAMSLVVKEAVATRRNEMLQLVLSNPTAQQIVGLQGTAELMRQNAKLLDMNPDRIVPSREQLQAQQMAAQQMQAQQMAAAMQPEQEHIQFQRDSSGAVTGAKKIKPRALLPDGSVAGAPHMNGQRPVTKGLQP